MVPMTSRSLAEHRADVLAMLPKPLALDVALRDAVGCVVMEDLVASVDVPSLAVAAWDGYAIVSADSPQAGGAPVTLPVMRDVAAGDKQGRLIPGTAARIAHGGPIPRGADAVWPQSTQDANQVVIDTPLAPGTGITAAGADARSGEVLVAAGTRLASGHVAVLAACGVKVARVIPSPRVVLVAIGSELTSGGSKAATVRETSAVYETSGALISALASQAGARVVRTVVVPDDAPAVRRAVEDAAMQAECVITMGGTSQDWRDVTVPVLEHALDVSMVEVRVGGGTWHGLGLAGDSSKPAVVIAIPGHPTAAVTAFIGYVRDALLHLRGLRSAPSKARAGAGWASPYGFSQVVPVARAAKDRGVVAPVGDAAHMTMRDLARSDGLALIDESVTEVKAGDPLDVVWWER